jgi:putative ABC transport system substrate-binding protein
MIGRRTFLVSAAGWMSCASGRARAQQGRTPVIGFLRAGEPPKRFLDALLGGLAQSGWVAGRNLTIETRIGTTEQLPALAEQLVRANVDVIVASASSAVAAAKQATGTIPIVMVAVYDPVELGLVASLARPGGNITGTAVTAGDMTGKRLQILRELVPTLGRVVMLSHPGHASNTIQVEAVEAAARALGLQIAIAPVRSEAELETTLGGLRDVGAVLHADTPLFNSNHVRLAAALARSRLPAIHPFRAYCDAGGLASYGADVPDLFRRSAEYVVQILKGARPSDLPVEQPTRFELVINARTAKALGLTIPPTLLAFADEVIE